jgi:transposase
LTFGESLGDRRFTDEFKAEEVKQIRGRGHPAAEVAERLGVSLQKPSCLVS